MAFQTYCDQADIESIFSHYGILYSVDDDRSNVVDTGAGTVIESQYILDAITRATLRINEYVSRLYVLTTLPSNLWTQWCCALFAAGALARRRGNGIPDGLQAEIDEKLAFLEDVRNGNAIIPRNEEGSSDAQLRVSNAGLCMTNLRLDQRFALAKVRSVSQISTGDQTSVLPRRPDYRAFRFVE